MKRLLLAFGFATWVLASNLGDAIHFSGAAVYHSQLGEPSIYLAVVGDYAVVVLLTLSLCAAVRGKLRHRWCALAAALGPVLIFNRIALGLGLQQVEVKLHLLRATAEATPDLAKALPLAAILSMWTLWILLCFVVFRPRPRATVAALNIFCYAGALFGCLLLTNATAAALRRMDDSRVAAAHPSTAQRRVIWVVMDELAYAPVFEHRVSDLQMPSFDRLAAESTVYSNAQPLGYWTNLVIPSLLSGKEFFDLHYSATGKLRFEQDDGKSRPFDARATVLADAERAGWNVGLVGWWNPYCTLFSGMLQQCFWSLRDAYTPMRGQDPVAENMWRSFAVPLRRMDAPPFRAFRMEEDFALLERGLAAIQDDRLDFVFFHIAVPHSPYFYDRHTGKLDPARPHSYQDGLAFADIVLGKVLAAAQANPRWNDTLLVVNGDHAWRTDLWKKEDGWTPEDFATSNGGKFDQRPLLLIHAPGQSQPKIVSDATELMSAHDVVAQFVKDGNVDLP